MTPRQLLRLFESRQPELFYDDYTPSEILDAEINSENLEQALHYVLSQLRQIAGTADWKIHPAVQLSDLAGLKAVVPALCTAAESVEDFVFINGPRIGGVIDVRKTNITSFDTMPSIGMIIEKSDDTHCTVQVAGEVTVTATLTPSRLCFIGADSQVRIDTPPGPGTRFAQKIGVATGVNTLQLSMGDQLVKLL